MNEQKGHRPLDRGSESKNKNQNFTIDANIFM